MQFGPGEDLDRYPRTFDSDLDVCAAEGVDVVFAPSVEEVYPGGEPQVTLDPGPLATILEGRTRPGHFRGVLTVVAKLFGLVDPDLAFFGQKDYQQLVLIRRMVADLCMGIEVVGVETVREYDGLALSSRNRYLDERARATALALSKALAAGAEAGPEGARPGPRRRPRRARRAGRRGRRRRLPRAHRARPGPRTRLRRGPAARRGAGRDHTPHRQHRPDPGRTSREHLMLRTMMKSKIHRATVTQADLHYVGSVTVDEDLLDAADLLPGELVHIVDITNGARLETYTIAGERGSGVIGINGAAARLVQPGDLVILIAYGQMETAEAREYKPSVVFVDADNKVVGTGSDPAEALPGSDLLRGDLTYSGAR